MRSQVIFQQHFQCIALELTPTIYIHLVKQELGDRRDRDRRDRGPHDNRHSDRGPPPVVNERFAKLADEEKEKNMDRDFRGAAMMTMDLLSQSARASPRRLRWTVPRLAAAISEMTGIGI